MAVDRGRRWTKNNKSRLAKSLEPTLTLLVLSRGGVLLQEAGGSVRVLDGREILSRDARAGSCSVGKVDIRLAWSTLVGWLGHRRVIQRRLIAKTIEAPSLARRLLFRLSLVIGMMLLLLLEMLLLLQAIPGAVHRAGICGIAVVWVAMRRRMVLGTRRIRAVAIVSRAMAWNPRRPIAKVVLIAVAVDVTVRP
jgi:hypothetical protein